jgi:dienelactone hydrolase
MADIVLLHHAQGLTPGVAAFASALADAGHVVVTPDLYDGHTFDDLDEGVAYARAHGEEIGRAAQQAVAAAPVGAVLAGMSLGAGHAQSIAMSQPGITTGLLLLHDGISSSDMEMPWPAGLPVQMHIAAHDPWCDLDSARLLAEESGGELFVYPGDLHLFTDSSLPAYDETLAGQVLERAVVFLAALG